ncbi:hypothetical protein CLV47_10366 [Antricoccus suffuscus]|uniref:Nucleoid-associated protein CLV47_10366 n=1 Tax=Antricoccus suffuscus TaxID=1629062 RepID=A0A2T1A330_9ACTN|nr:YbaB/EbfC family nucleoid-associated protein [Antricoccus suffuscus]PRZ43010.1 hypothetical protein CLV47_10366 [Antricoccus suffuscus]
MQPGGQPDMQQIMKQAQQMQEQLQKAQQEIQSATVEGSAGSGLVKVVMTGGGELQSIEIDPKAVDPDDVETLQDLIIAAVRDGSREASELAQKAMGPLAGGMGGLGLPGM